MQTFKKIIKWVAIIVIVYIAIDFANFYIIASNYKDIESKSDDSNDLNITINESKATYVNGYIKLTVKNNSNLKSGKKYILLDGYSEYDNCLVSKYEEISNIEAGESKQIEINYKAQEVKKVVVYIDDKKPEENDYKLSDEKVDGPTILITAIIFLYFFG